jgi:apolipoprotein D and lipocalin family protein
VKPRVAGREVPSRTVSTLLRNVGASMRNWQVLRVHEATGRLDLAGTLAMTPALLARAARTTAVLALAVLVQAADVHTADAQPAPSSLRTIERLDVPRYMGTWYEIAKFPNRFQCQCTSDTRAEYAAQPDGTVRVVNRCRTEGGKTTEAVGLAQQVGGPDSPKLQVRFAPAWLSWLPAVWGDYWIVDLDPDYQLVAVSEPSRKYLWILARSPHVDPAREGAMLKRLAEQGLDISRLQPTPHATQAPVGG